MGSHKFTELEYSFDALEPHIDAKTMEIHSTKHHRTYFDKFVAAIKNTPKFQEKPIEEILSNLPDIPESIRQIVINNGGGFYHHTFFFSVLAKNKPFSEDSEIGHAISKKWGGLENFKEEFEQAATTLFGSGWAWLVLDKTTSHLEIIQTKNQNCPLSISKIPLIGLDIWEHAYYLKYQNHRADYIKEFWNIINWEKVNEIYKDACKKWCSN